MHNKLRTCSKDILQYVEKTASRLNNYKINGKNFRKEQAYMQQHLFEHFSNEGYCNFFKGRYNLIYWKNWS